MAGFQIFTYQKMVITEIQTYILCRRLLKHKNMRASIRQLRFY
jgi:hypothetical protein